MEFLSSAALIASATLVAIFGALRAVDNQKVVNPTSSDENASPNHHEISCKYALLFPVVASFSLITLYLFFDYIQYLFVLYLLFVGVGSLAFLLNPWVAILRGQPLNNPRGLSVSAGAFAAGIVLTCVWAWSGHWVLNNLIGVGLCFTIMSVLKIPSFKIATILLVGLLIYDFYWVYLSSYHFGSNVMVKVAQQAASNPVADVASFVPIVKDLPKDWLPMPKLDLPNKIMFPVLVSVLDEHTLTWNYVLSFMMLGLGDIALPGLLLAYARLADVNITAAKTTVEADVSEQIAVQVPLELVQLRSARGILHEVQAVGTQLADVLRKRSLFRTAVIGFAIGLAMAIFVSRAFHAAQPALIYIVPACIIPVLAHARSDGVDTLNALWTGQFQKAEQQD
jgi:signal peptide peptidase-like protein 3